MSRAELLVVLREARALVARPDNDFSWSGWDGPDDALAELDGHISTLEAGAAPSAALRVLFLPTGPLQELSLSSGWGDAFCAVADRFDAALDAAMPPRR